MLDTATVALAHPIQTATAVVSSKSTINDVITSHFSQPLSTQIKQTVLGTAGIAATIVTAGAATSAAKAGTLLPALIPSTTKGKIIAAVAAPVVVGAVVNQPAKAAAAIAKTPAALANVGGNIANLAANPSIEGVKNLVKENPVIVGGAIAAGAAALGAGALGVITNIQNTQAVKENTAATLSGGTSLSTMPVTMPEFSNDNIKEAQPQTPITKTITNAPKTSRKPSRQKKKQPTNINQRVNVIVSNRSSSVGISNKRFLKERILV